MSSHLTQYVLDNAPRLLSCIDRRPNSITYGCSDRNYWHYNIIDFPCAMLQETALSIALLYSTKFKGNIYYKKNYIKKLAIAQIDYWCKIQKRNGSFDEFYPNEQSFSATAFTLYSTCYTVKILGINASKYYLSAKKACQFLINYGNPGASNQIAAAIAAINIFSQLFDSDSFNDDVETMLDELLKSQSSEGWTPEYGGFDVGYQSITISYLSDYCRLNPSKNLSDRLNKMIEFLSNFIHPDGTVGGEYCSRNTSFLAPFGFAYNINKSSKISSAIITQLFINPNSNINRFLDDRYICHFIIPSYLLSIDILNDEDNNEKLPCNKSFSTFFKESGIWINSTSDYYFICNIKKQGVFKLYGKNSQGIISDLGYSLTNDNILAITNWINNNVSFNHNNNSCVIKGSFFQVSNHHPNSLYHFILRLLSYFFRSSLLPILKKYFITREKPIKGSFERSIKISDDNITIEDKIIYLSKKKTILSNNDSSTFRYVAPSNYFQTNQLLFSNQQITKDIDNNQKISQKIDLNNFRIDKSFVN